MRPSLCFEGPAQEANTWCIFSHISFKDSTADSGCSRGSVSGGQGVTLPTSALPSWPLLPRSHQSLIHWLIIALHHPWLARDSISIFRSKN